VRKIYKEGKNKRKGQRKEDKEKVRENGKRGEKQRSKNYK
jgi:hypothetical protein